jgi:drug/metabolite transporter (DMT)-like permease
MDKKKLLTAYLALISGILALSLSALFVRWANAPGLVTTCYRMIIAAFVFGILFWRQPGTLRKRLLKWWYFPLLGGLFSALDHGMWSTAVNLTQMGNATLFNNLAPLWVSLAAVLIWKEKLGKWFWFGLLLTLSGALVVLGTNLLNNPQFSNGDILALISSLFYAMYFLNTQKSRQVLNTISYVFGSTLATALILWTYCFLNGYQLFGYDTNTYLAFLGAALISQVIGYFSIGYALGNLPAAIVSPTMITQPVITALLAIPLAGEVLLTGQWIGGFVTLLGIYFINRSWTKNQPH